MTTTINNQASREVFLFACEICENDNPSVTHRVATHFADEMSNLVSNNAFVTDSLNYCINKNGDAEELCFKNSQPGYFDDDNNFISVSFENFTKYNLKLDWIVNHISRDFGFYEKDCEEILPHVLWSVGIANLDLEVPIFFARKIRQEETFDRIKKALNQRKSNFQGLILTSCSDIPSYFSSRIAGNKIVPLKSCLSANNKDFHIDKGVLKSAMIKTGKDGFTTGYRSARFNGEYFRFTKQEADVLECLHKAGRPVHKDEIMVEVTESSTELRTLFRSSDSKNIRNNILQHDSKGYYWLNLN
jgi:hypothetical protein